MDLTFLSSINTFHAAFQVVFYAVVVIIFLIIPQASTGQLFSMRCISSTAHVVHNSKNIAAHFEA